jgi:hypothetical protein
LKSLTNTLLERVDELVEQPSKRALVWGNPRLSSTPSSIAVHELAIRIEALENAVREIALEVQKLVDQV